MHNHRVEQKNIYQTVPKKSAFQLINACPDPYAAFGNPQIRIAMAWALYEQFVHTEPEHSPTNKAIAKQKEL